MASAAEAEYGALFLNGQSAVLIRTKLIEMHHSQPPTLIQDDNSTAVGINNKSSKKNPPRQWICFFVGYRIEFSRNTLKSFGNQGLLIKEITTPNITPLLITSKCDILTFMNHIVNRTHFKGVLISQTVILQVQA